MPFLKRSKSQKVSLPKDEVLDYDSPGIETEVLAAQVEAAEERRRSRFERRTSIFARSKSADANKGTERPRTANRAQDRNQDRQPIINETIEIETDGATYAFPTPSPRLPPVRSATMQALPSPLTGLDSPRIGIAIGSPTQAPSWGRSHTSDQISGRMPKQPMPIRMFPSAVREEPEEGTPRPELRRKKSGWKALGSFFRSKTVKATDAEPFYKVRPDEAAPTSGPQTMQPLGVLETPQTSPALMQSPGSISSHHSRSPSVPRGLARFEARAEADRASLMPNIDGKLRRSSSIPNNKGTAPPTFKALPPIRDSADMFKTLPGADRNDSPLSTTGFSATGTTPRTPRLDLDIPNGEMERYSVMFEKQLAPRQSILERRQSKKQKKQNGSPITPASEQPAMPLTVKANARSSAVPQRSVTSPHLHHGQSLQVALDNTKDQAASSFDEPRTAIHRPRPIKRSKTAPAGSVSPVAPNFSRPKAPTFASSDSDASRESPLYGENSLPPTPTTVTTSTDASSMIAIKQPADYSLPRVRQDAEGDEPSWDMLTSTAPGSLSPPPEDIGRNVYPKVKSAEDLERQIVQVSVARQVSVSRARRQVQKAVASKQPLRPRVVELNKNRKSTVVLIEGGDD